MGLNVAFKDIDDVREFLFNGSIDEDFDINDVLSSISKEMIFNLKGINKITSFGVKLWIDLLGKIPENCMISYEECSIPFINQVNMISNFIQKGEIKTYFAPFICEDGHEFEKLMNIQDVKFKEGEYLIPKTICPTCKTECELDEFPDDFLAFLSIDDE